MFIVKMALILICLVMARIFLDVERSGMVKNILFDMAGLLLLIPYYKFIFKMWGNK